ncbi:MAG: hypothetical protein ABJB66_15340, partial [Gemmatimonadaceae bacterium]
ALVWDSSFCIYIVRRAKPISKLSSAKKVPEHRSEVGRTFGVIRVIRVIRVSKFRSFQTTPNCEVLSTGSI